MLLFAVVLLFSTTLFSMKRVHDQEESVLAGLGLLPLDIKRSIAYILVSVLPSKETLKDQAKQEIDALPMDSVCLGSTEKACRKNLVKAYILKNFRPLLSLDKNFSTLLYDQEFMGSLIISLAKRYALSNYEIAEMLGTKTAAAWCKSNLPALVVSVAPAEIKHKVVKHKSRCKLFQNSLNGRQLLFKLLSAQQIPDRDKEIALYECAQAGKPAVMRALLESGCYVDAVPHYDQATALHAAAAAGHLEAVDLLLEFKAHVDVPDITEKTPLMKAVVHGHDGVVSRLVLARADMDLADKAGNTAYSMAVQQNNTKIIRVLDCLRILIASQTLEDHQKSLMNN